MTKLLSTIHAGLRLPALDIKFVDGVAEVPEHLVDGALEYAYIGVALAGDEYVDDAEDAPADSDDTDEDEGDETEAEDIEAPKPNASREEWAAYAAALGVLVADGAKRDDIRALFD